VLRYPGLLVSGKKKAGNAQARSTAVSAACLAAAILSVAGAWRSFDLAAAYAQQYPDTYGVSMAEARFAPVLGRIPDREPLGYITDLDPADTRYHAALMGAQYAVAPRHLFQLTGANRPHWAVGNFYRESDRAALAASKGYKVVTDLGNGVVLFRRQSP